MGKRDKLLIFGDDYPTSDGTGKRDYIHVCDLAKAHLLSLNYLFENESLFSIFNIGTGKSYSVLEVIKIFEKVSGVNIPFEITARRLGDVAECVADPTKAKRILGWEAELDLYRMCVRILGDGRNKILMVFKYEDNFFFSFYAIYKKLCRS